MRRRYRYVDMQQLYYCVLAASGAVVGPGAPPSSPPAAPTSPGTGASTASNNQLADNWNNLIIERNYFLHSCCWSQITDGYKYKILVYCFIESACDCCYFFLAVSPRSPGSRDPLCDRVAVLRYHYHSPRPRHCPVSSAGNYCITR